MEVLPPPPYNPSVYIKTEKKTTSDCHYLFHLKRDMSNFFSQQTTLVKCVVLVLSFWNPMMEQMGNSGLLSSQDESRNYDIRPRYIKVLHYKQKNNNREHLQRKKRTPLRWISLSNKMIHTLIASTTFLIIHATTIYTWAAKHSRSSRRLD